MLPLRGSMPISWTEHINHSTHKHSAQRRTHVGTLVSLGITKLLPFYFPVQRLQALGMH